MATIYADTGSAPVRVRNLSPSGALIEGLNLPVPNTQVRLSRGGLSTTGDVVWHKDGRAGLRFESPVSVADWLPRGRSINAQQRVDEVVQQTKASTDRGLPRPPVTCVVSHPSRLGAVDLTQLVLAIHSLAEDLAADPAVVERHGSKLQTLDIAGQALGKLASESRLSFLPEFRLMEHDVTG